MKINVRKHLYLIGFLIFTISASTFGLVSGCSKDKGDKDAEGDESAAATDEAASQTVTYEPIQEKILGSIRDDYSAKGFEIVNIELSSGDHDQVKIDIRGTDKSEAQSVLAGLSILHDNFPKMKGYHATAGGEEYSSTPDVLAYISGKGYTVEGTPEDATAYMDIIKNGIPPDQGESVNTETK